MAAYDSSSSFSSESDTFWHSQEEDSSNSSTDVESNVSHGEREQLGAHPYMFEPEGETDSDHDAGDDDADNGEHDHRLGNNAWCTCGECQPMDTVRESVCCQEIDNIKNMMETFVLDVDCILEHPGFRTVCLDRWVLDTAYAQYRQQYGGQGLEGIANTKYRHTAYRQLTRWCWGFLGRQVRVVLPACAVRRIRETFPAEDGQYKGFAEV